LAHFGALLSKQDIILAAMRGFRIASLTVQKSRPPCLAVFVERVHIEALARESHGTTEEYRAQPFAKLFNVCTFSW